MQVQQQRLGGCAGFAERGDCVSGAGYAEYWYYLVYTAGRMATRTSRDSQNNRVAPEPYNDLPLRARNTAWRGRGVFFLSYSDFFACCPARVNIPFTLP